MTKFLGFWRVGLLPPLLSSRSPGIPDGEGGFKAFSRNNESCGAISAPRAASRQTSPAHGARKSLSFSAMSVIAFLALSSAALAQSSNAFDALPGSEQVLEAPTPGVLSADADGAVSINTASSPSAAFFSATTAKDRAATGNTTPLDLDAALAEFLKLPDCPFDKIREAYERVVTDQDVFNTLAITEQVLLICSERQDLITAYISDAKKVMDGLREAALASEALIAVQNQERALKAEIDALLITKTQVENQIANARRLQAALETAPPAAANAESQAAETPLAPSTEVVATSDFGLKSRYSLIATTGFDEDARAMLLDAESGETLHVKTGDILPGGVTIASINGLSVIAQAPSGSFEVSIAEEENAAEVNRSIGGIAWREVGAKPKAATETAIKTPMNLAGPTESAPAATQSVTVFEGYSQ